MRIFRIALAIIAIAVATPAAAQSDYMHTIVRIGHVSLVNRHPYCNPFTQAFDPVWIHNEGWRMPRIAWHVMYPALNYGISASLLKLSLNRTFVATISPLPLALIPHVLQLLAGIKHGQVYEANAPDWAYDAWNRSFPTWELLSDSTNRKRNLLIWAAGDVALSCFARP